MSSNISSVDWNTSEDVNFDIRADLSLALIAKSWASCIFEAFLDTKGWDSGSKPSIFDLRSYPRCSNDSFFGLDIATCSLGNSGASTKCSVSVSASLSGRRYGLRKDCLLDLVVAKFSWVRSKTGEDVFVRRVFFRGSRACDAFLCCKCSFLLSWVWPAGFFSASLMREDLRVRDPLSLVDFNVESVAGIEKSLPDSLWARERITSSAVRLTRLL